jgi:putative tryptophan/tyrosine transport system substrate-binding protein
MKYISAIVVLALCPGAPVFAQDAASLPLVGVLRINTPDTIEPMATQFRARLAVLGWSMDARFASTTGSPRATSSASRGSRMRWSLRTRELSSPSAIRRSARPSRRPRSIPIVALADDLVASGLIASLARPGGNTTGVSILATELDAKKLEVLKQIVPATRRFGLLSDPANTVAARLRAIADRGRTLGVEVQTAEVRGAGDIAPAFAAFRAGGAALVPRHGLSISSSRSRARWWRLPT